MADARLRYGDKEVRLGEVTGTENDVGLDVSPIGRELGVHSFDPGLANTAEALSGITYIDGVGGVLRYRGYPIEELASRSSFLETAYLLMHGELPSLGELQEFQAAIEDQDTPPEQLKSILEQFPSSAHPTQMLSASIGALGAFQPEDAASKAGSVQVATHRLLGQVPTIIAWISRVRADRPYPELKSSKDYVWKFLHAVFSEDEDYEPQPEVVDALNTLLILHADHGQNCSTTAARLVGSSGADIFASMSAAVHALSGPKHGGANQEVLEMLDRIHTGFASVAAFVELSKSKGSRIAGFGHRVYKTFDPRAKYIKQAAVSVFEKLHVDDPLLDIATELETTALSDDYFIDRQLYPNVDFYSGLIYRALGFPADMFTVLFALGRLPGWIAHWREGTMANGRIYRPRQVYVGPRSRAYVPVDQRSGT